MYLLVLSLDEPWREIEHAASSPRMLNDLAPQQTKIALCACAAALGLVLTIAKVFSAPSSDRTAAQAGHGISSGLAPPALADTALTSEANTIPTIRDGPDRAGAGMIVLLGSPNISIGYIAFLAV